MVLCVHIQRPLGWYSAPNEAVDWYFISEEKLIHRQQKRAAPLGYCSSLTKGNAENKPPNHSRNAGFFPLTIEELQKSWPEFDVDNADIEK